MLIPRVSRRRRGGALKTVAIVGVLSIGAAACGSSGSAGSSAQGSTGASSALGPSNAATGSPVTIGMISDGGSGAIGTAPLVEQGAKMAVAYANAYQSGLDGHTLQLFLCENQGTPAGGQDCANQMVQKKVVAVVEPFTGQGATEVPTITQAGIPWLELSGASAQELTTPGAFIMTGGLPAYLGAVALDAKARGYTQIAFLILNVPAAIQGAQAFGNIVFKKAGVGFQLVPVNPGTADLTPQLQTAASSGASAIGMVGDLTICSSFLKGYQALGLSLPKYVLSSCLDPSILDSSLDSVLKGSIINPSVTATAQDRALYGAITKKFAPSVNSNPDVSSNQVDGLQPVLDLLTIMKGYTGDMTPAAVTQKIEQTSNLPLPFTGGANITCNGTAVPLLKSVCSAAMSLGTIQTGSTVTDIKFYDPTPLFS